MPYIGNSPGTGTRNRFIYTATASQTTFSGADDNGKTLKYADSDYVDVYLNGICLVPVTDYTSTSKTSIVLTQAASLNDTLEVVAYDIATISDTVSKANGGTFESRISIGGSTTEDPMLYVNTGTSANNFNGVFIENSNDATATAPDLTLYRNSSSPADDDNLGSLWYYGQNDADERTLYAGIHGSIADVTDADEGGRIEFFGMTAGSTETWAVIEEGNVGIGTDVPVIRLDSRIDTATEWDGSYNLSNANNRPIYALQLANDDTSITNSEVNLLFSAGASGSAQHSIGVKRTGTNDGDMVFRRRTNGSSAVSMSIDSNGHALFENQIHLNSNDSYFISKAANGYRFNNSTNAFNNMIIAENGNVTIRGALSKGSGSFRIPHPLEAKRETNDLVHSFLEAPQADNLYRGKVDLVAGSATVNIDTVAGMTEGTFAALNREVQCFTSNETGWTAVKGSVSGNILTINAQESDCTDTISWMVVGERKDQHMYDTDWTDENGKVIVEPTKRPDKI